MKKIEQSIGGGTDNQKTKLNRTVGEGDFDDFGFGGHDSLENDDL